MDRLNAFPPARIFVTGTDVEGALTGGGASATTGGEPSARLTLAVAVTTGVYMAVVVAFAAAGRHAFVFKTVLIPVLLLVAIVGQRARTFVQDWIVFLSAVVLFDAFRGFIFASSIVLKRQAWIVYPIQWEKFLFDTPAVGLPLQSWLTSAGITWVVEPILVVLHASHFAFFLLFGLGLWAMNRSEFGRWAIVMLLTMVGGLVCYAATPTAPPWLASQWGAIPRLEHVAAVAYNSTVPSLHVVLDTNPVAAMPSLHAAFPVACALAATRVWGRYAAALWLYACAMAFALTYLGEHYAVDVLAGALLAVLAHSSIVFWPRLLDWLSRLGWTRWPASRHFTHAMMVVLAAVLLSCWTTALVPALQLP